MWNNSILSLTPFSSLSICILIYFHIKFRNKMKLRKETVNVSNWEDNNPTTKQKTAHGHQWVYNTEKIPHPAAGFSWSHAKQLNQYVYWKYTPSNFLYWYIITHKIHIVKKTNVLFMTPGHSDSVKWSR